MRNLLSFRHWQLFLLIFICGAWTSPIPLKQIINSIAIVTFTLWIYAIGVYGQGRITELGLKPMNIKLFKVNVVAVGVFLIIGLALSVFQREISKTTTQTFELKNVLYTIGGLYLAFAMVQTIVFVCKTIAKLEFRREVSFGEYFNNILLMFFFFIGIWFLQPKINRLISTDEKVAF